MECKICMEVFPKDVFQYLPCAHSLCKFCFTKIKKQECPYCKYSFSEEMTEEEEQEFIETLELIEEPINKRRKKKNKKKKKQLLFELSKNSNSINSNISYNLNTNFSLLNL